MLKAANVCAIAAGFFLTIISGDSDIKCPKNPTYNGILVSYTNDNYVNSIAVFRCSQERTLVGSNSSTCQSDGTWSNPWPKCEKTEIRCPELRLNTRRGNFIIRYENDRKVHSAAFYSCRDITQKLIGENRRTCLENGKWSRTFPSCEAAEIRCPELQSNTPRGNFIIRYENNRKVHSAAMYSCRENNQILIGESWRMCLENGEWSRTFPSCEDIPGCRLKRDDASHLVIDPVKDHYRFGDFVSLQCPPGEKLTSDVEGVMCLGKSWSDDIPDCKETSQTTPSSLRKTAWCSTDVLAFPGLLKGRKSFYRDGEIFEIVCDARYQIANTGMLKCENGLWKGLLPPCIAASCVGPPPSVHGAEAEVSSMTHGSIVKYVCEDPYVLIQTSPMQCLFGKWEGQLPRCDDGRCYLEKLENSSHISSDSPSVTNSGDELKVICKEGYSPVAEPPKCVNGKWTRNIDSPCKENLCSVPIIYHGDLFEQRFGEFHFSWKSVSYVRDVFDVKIRPNATVFPATTYILKCHNGYSFQGTRISAMNITCTRGRWFPDPVCISVGSRYVPRTPAVNRASATMSSIRVSLEKSHPDTSTAETTPLSVSPTGSPTIEVTTEQKLDEHTPTEAESVVDECSCEYPINDDNLVATVDGRRLKFRDIVQVESVVVFRCEHVGFHRFIGQRENRCGNCGRWYTNTFPACIQPIRGDAVILFDKNLNVSVEGNLEVRKGQSVVLNCVVMESAMYPQWKTPTEDGIRVMQERKERKTYGDVLYVSHLEIESADLENEGPYKCAAADNSVATVYVTVIDPNVQCPAFDEEGSISVDYETGRRMRSKASFVCSNPSQELVGKAVVTCLRNGQWSDPPPYCQNKKCKELKGTDLLQIIYTNDTEVGSLATFHCFVPGKRSGVSFSKCLENGSWSDPTPTCITPFCAVADLYSTLLPNVVPDIDDIMNTTLPYNTIIKMTCAKDFIVAGDSFAKCGKNGTWEVQNTECISGCPSLNKPPDSKLIVMPEKQLYKFAETVTFSCPPGMDLDTDFQRIMCLKTGWSETFLPTCK